MDCIFEQPLNFPLTNIHFKKNKEIFTPQPKLLQL